MKFIQSKRILVTQTFKQSIHPHQYFGEVNVRKGYIHKNELTIDQIKKRGMFGY